MQLNKDPQRWLAVGLQFEEQEGIKKRGFQVLKDDVIYWVITMGGRGWGQKNNADCLHVLKPPFSFLHNTTCTVVSSFNLGPDSLGKRLTLKVSVSFKTIKGLNYPLAHAVLP